MATVTIKDDIYKTITKIAKKENTTKDNVLNEILEKGSEYKAKSKIPDYLIGNKNRKPDTERKKEWWDLLRELSLLVL